jgi:hypothetical protein
MQAQQDKETKPDKEADQATLLSFAALLPEIDHAGHPLDSSRARDFSAPPPEIGKVQTAYFHYTPRKKIIASIVLMVCLGIVFLYFFWMIVSYAGFNALTFLFGVGIVGVGSLFIYLHYRDVKSESFCTYVGDKGFAKIASNKHGSKKEVFVFNSKSSVVYGDDMVRSFKISSVDGNFLYGFYQEKIGVFNIIKQQQISYENYLYHFGKRIEDALNAYLSLNIMHQLSQGEDISFSLSGTDNFIMLRTDELFIQYHKRQYTIAYSNLESIREDVTACQVIQIRERVKNKKGILSVLTGRILLSLPCREVHNMALLSEILEAKIQQARVKTANR